MAQLASALPNLINTRAQLKSSFTKFRTFLTKYDASKGISSASTRVLYKTAAIKSGTEDFSTKLSFLKLEKITENLPLHLFDTKRIHIPENLRLADPNFNKSGKLMYC